MTATPAAAISASREGSTRDAVTVYGLSEDVVREAENTVWLSGSHSQVPFTSTLRGPNGTGSQWTERWSPSMATRMTTATARAVPLRLPDSRTAPTPRALPNPRGLLRLVPQRRSQAARTPFAVVLVVLLGGGLLGLLLLNTLVAQGSFTLHDLSTRSRALQLREQQLAGQVQAQQAPGQLAARASALGMGDTGSLSLGGLLAGIAIVTRTELLLVVLGGLFVIETLSVIVQVGFFKLTRRRVFRMAPFHHHFELGGWNENTVIVRFWILAGLAVAFGLGLFYAEFLSNGSLR